MATWKITVKDTITYNGVHLEKGMFVEYITPTLDHPLFKTMHHDAVNQLFIKKNKTLFREKIGNNLFS